jgi:hypothetical protein
VKFSKQRQEDHNFKASLGYITTPCLKRKKENKNILCQELVVVIPAAQEAEIRRIVVQSQPPAISL